MTRRITVHLDPHKVNSKRHKHHDNQGWFNVYYYRKSKKLPASYEVTSFKSHRANVFYKVQSLSNQSDLWDYYRIKKVGVDHRIRNYSKNTQKKPPPAPFVPKKLTKESLVLHMT